MKLTRFLHDGSPTPTPGLFLDDTTILDASSFGEDWNEAFFGNDGLVRLQDWLGQKQESAPTVRSSEVTLAPAVARPSKLICIGLNYAAHAAEGGMEPPAEPVLFSKATSSWTVRAVVRCFFLSTKPVFARRLWAHFSLAFEISSKRVCLPRHRSNCLTPSGGKVPAFSWSSAW